MGGTSVYASGRGRRLCACPMPTMGDADVQVAVDGAQVVTCPECGNPIPRWRRVCESCENGYGPGWNPRPEEV